MSSKVHSKADQHGRLIQFRWIVLLIAVGLSGLALAFGGAVSEAESTPTADKYYLRVSGCDDGGKAFIAGTLIVDVGFDEDSNWLDITEDVAKGKRDIKFRVVNKTGAITYDFQLKKNNEVIFNQTCGRAKLIGCENNRAFRVGIAREFLFSIPSGR